MSGINEIVLKIFDVYFIVLGGILSILGVGFLFYSLVKGVRENQGKSVFLVAAIGALACVSTYSHGAIYIINVVFIALLSGFYYFYLGNYIAKRNGLKKISFKPLGPVYPQVTILIAARDESAVIGDTILAIDKVNYPKDKLKVLVVDDHSEDTTLEILSNLECECDLSVISNIWENGKANALNYALQGIDSEYTLVLDADHHLEADFIIKMLPKFTEPSIAFVQGKNIVRNGDTSLLARIVEVEYHSLFEIIYNSKLMPLFLGTGAIFRTSALKDVEGFSTETATEDIDIAFRLHQAGYDAFHDRDVTTYELATPTVGGFLKQRNRWMRGIFQGLTQHGKAILADKGMPLHKKIDFFHIPVCFWALIGHFFIHAFYFLDRMGIVDIPFSSLGLWILYPAILLVISVSLIVMKRKKLLFLLPLLPIFYGIFSLAALSALFDEAVFKKKLNFKAMKVNR